MEGFSETGLIILLGVLLLLVSGAVLIQQVGLVPVTLRFVFPFHYDARGDDLSNLNDEYVTLRNLYQEEVDMSGWTMMNQAGVTFTFPEGFVLASQAKVTVYSGCGVDTDSELYWCSERPLWQNDSDEATLRDTTGRLIDKHAYHRECRVCGS
jgi:hypothetical protein